MKKQDDLKGYPVSRVIELLPLRCHLNSASLHVLGLGQIEGQDAVGIVSLRTLGVDGGGQGKRLLELTSGETIPVYGRVLGDIQPGLPLQSQGILLSGDLHVLRVDSRHRELENEAVGCLEQVRG